MTNQDELLEKAAREYADKQFELFRTQATEDAFKAGAAFQKELSAKEISELKQIIEKLQWQLKQFKHFGTDQCRKCEGGRISLFYANSECISCNPDSYKSFEEYGL